MQLEHPRLAVFLPFLLLAGCSAPADRILEHPSAAPSAAAEPAAVPPQPREPRETAVEAGLVWLARHQLADGSWRVGSIDAECLRSFAATQGGAWSDHYDVGSTALGLLALVRGGWTRGRHGEIGGAAHVAPAAMAARALDWLRGQQNPEGFFSRERSFLYNDALATLALAEHFAATRDESEREAAQRAVDFLQRAQRPSPAGSGAWGWRYQSRQEIEAKFSGAARQENELRELYDSDVSVTGWACAALLAAEAAGLKVDPAALAGAREFVRWCTGRDGLVGYNDPRNAGLTVQGRNDFFDYHPTCMSAIALRLACDGGALEGDFVLQAARRIAMDPPTVSANHLSIDYYYWFHGTLALRALGPADRTRYLAPWTKSLESALLPLQERGEGSGCGGGAWLVPDRWSYATGPIHTTALALLALEAAG